MIVYGSGKISKTWKKRKGNGYEYSAIIKDLTNCELKIKYFVYFKTFKSIEAKELFQDEKKIYFNGLFNQDGEVEADLVRNTLEELRFSVRSDSEEIFSYTSNGLKLEINIKAPKFNFFGKCTQLFAKATNNEVLNRLTVVLKSSTVSINGYMTNGRIVLTSLEKSKKK
jgi:hypothetical protein